MIALTWVLTSVAFAVDQNICIEIETNFDDAGGIDALDDYFTQVGPEPMRGVRIGLFDHDAGTTSYHWTSGIGPDPGCATIDLDVGTQYTLSVWSKALVWGNELRVIPALGAGTTSLEFTDVIDPSRLAPDHAYTVTSLDMQWSYLALAAWGVFHRSGGVGLGTAEVWYIHTQPCPGSTGSCFTCDGDDDDINAVGCFSGPPATDLDDNAGIWTDTTSRYVLMHELGHYMLSKRNGMNSVNTNYNVNLEQCFCAVAPCQAPYNHAMQQKEWNSAGFSEGFAHFYAAATLNDSTQSDCFFNYYKSTDWDFDGVLDDMTMNCEGNPNWQPTGWGAGGEPAAPIDHVNYKEDSALGLGCGTIVANRSTEYDWLRFLWDLHTDTGWSVVEILDVIDATNPQSWNGISDGVMWWAPKPGEAFRQTLAQPPYAGAMESEWNFGAARHGVD